MRPSDKVKVTMKVPTFEFNDALGDIMISLPDIVMKAAEEDSVIMTVTPSGSTADGSV